MLKWSDGESTPLEDLRAAMKQVMNTTGYGPSVLYMSLGTYIRIMRRTMTKRQFRRWRGRVRHGR